MQNFVSILLLLIAITFVLSRLKKVDLGHSKDFLRRRILNWLPLGLTYAFLYMGRYNLTVSKNNFGDLMTNADFGTIFGVGTIVYGFAFLINGPLTDKWGGRLTIMIAAIGSAFANLLMGLVTYFHYTENLLLTFSILYGLNMYFQSFGAVAIVKVNSAWFHVKERGTFGGIFGILISLGLYFAYDWSALIAKNFPLEWVFYVPMGLLLVFTGICYFLVFDEPKDVGFSNLVTGEASLSKEGEEVSVFEIVRRMASNPVLVTIGVIEFCSGFLRNAIMHWYIIFSKQTGGMSNFVPTNWGLLLCIAGIMGGVFAGTISDKFFGSRRGPMAAVLYGMMLIGAVFCTTLLNSPLLGPTVIVMSMAIIGVHGMLSATASMDFAGKKNVGVVVGLIDGLVYLGTATQSLYYGYVLPNGDLAKDPSNWMAWPVAMIPVAAIGLVFALKIWKAHPDTHRHRRG